MYQWLAFVPLLTYLLTVGAVYARRQRRESEASGWSEALLIAAVLCAVWVILGAELLSLFHQLRFWPVLLWWLVPTAALGAFLLWCGPQVRAAANFGFWIFDFGLPRQRCPKSGIEYRGSRISWCGGVSLVLAGVIMVYAGLSAFFSPPNNMDSLNYDMPRIIFWMQQHSLADFPTNDLSQLVMPPFTEFVGLHLLILTHGADRLINFVDWTALLLLALAVSSIARYLGADADSQALAGVMVVSMPAAFCQATTFVPEIVEALWTIIAAGWLWQVAVSRRCGWGRMLLIAAAVGLMALTHGTSYIFGLPIALLASVSFWRSYRWKMPLILGLCGVVLVFLNLGFFTRNLAAFGAPLGPLQHGPWTALTRTTNGPFTGGNADTTTDLQLLNSVITPRTIMENMLRDAGVMFAGPSDTVNHAVNGIIGALAGALGVNLQDPRTLVVMTPGVTPTYNGAVYEPGNEYAIAWPLQMLLFLLIPFGLFLRQFRDRPSAKTSVARQGWLFLLLGFGGWVISAAVLRWQPIMAHLLPALPALIIPVAAVALGWRPVRVLQPAMAIALAVWLLPTMLLFPRPLVGSQAVEFKSRVKLLTQQQNPEYQSIAGVVDDLTRRHPHLVGLYSNSLPPTYALMAPLLQQLDPQPRLTYFNAVIQIPGVREPDPDVVIGPMGGPPLLIHADTGRRYRLVKNCSELAIYTPCPAIYSRRAAFDRR